jgi:spore germination cell wall hydrolase CwlJ-like protein
LRIRCLFLTLVLTGSATPLHASLGIAPQCTPFPSQVAKPTAEPKPPVPKLNSGVPTRAQNQPPVPNNFDAEDRDLMIRTIAFEASDEPDEGKAAVAHVILNRAKSGRWGDSIKDVVTDPWQFEPWMMRRKEVESLSPSDPRYRDAARIADDVISGQMPDPTAGATHFLNPTVVRNRRGGTLPAWAQGEGQPIGRHTFYKPEKENADLKPVTVAMDSLDASLSCSPEEAGDVPNVDLMTLAEVRQP